MRRKSPTAITAQLSVLSCTLYLLGALSARAQATATTVFANARVQPASMPWMGGSVQLSVDVSDSAGVTDVSAHVQYADGFTDIVGLTRMAETNTWTGMDQVNGNFSRYDTFAQVLFAGW